MPKVVITHNVINIDNWLKGKSERADAIAGMGGAHVVDYVAQDGSNSIAVTCDSDDVASIMSAIADPAPDLAAAMERHGVVPPLAVYIEK